MSMIGQRGAPRYPIVLGAELTVMGTEATLNRRTPDNFKAKISNLADHCMMSLPTVITCED